ncbi:hypothetical protein K9L16_04015 [Candidatus Pacearchaeota archaeon]|nr:hypothetical protein [Candidatus Pacearchaeota archaeon]
MRIRLTKIALLGALVASSLSATEFRSPSLSERGPIRYRFEKWKNKWTLDLWGTGHYREAHKAFIKHGTDTKPLSALIFNKSDFPLAEMFPNKTMPINSTNYNPFIAWDGMTVSPRVQYTEFGADWGAKLDFPVWKNKGKIGLRARVPFRYVEMERENITDKNTNVNDEVVITKATSVKTGDNDAGGDRQVYAKAYNFGFVSKLTQVNGSRAVEVGANFVKIFGNPATGDLGYPGDVTARSMVGEVKAPVGIIYNATNSDRPTDPKVSNPNGVGALTDHYWTFNADNFFNTTGATKWTYDNIYKYHEVSGKGVASAANVDIVIPGINLFNGNINALNTTDYSTLLTDNDPQLNSMWLVFARTGGVLTNEANTIQTGIDAAIAKYDVTPEEWLLKFGSGYEMETFQRTGLGDIDLDLFYNHHFSKSWIGELFFGVRFPTSTDNNYYGNPYKVQTGNGQHWELKVGGYVAWQPLGWLNMKLDVYGGFALEGKEKRMAAYKGAEIKNMGPRVDADVDYQYFVGRFDFNFFHPKDHSLCGDLGYEFYYKTKDSIKYKQSSVTPFYGDKISGSTAYTSEEAGLLDASVLERNTQAISHKVRWEGSWKATKCLDLFVGASFVFAGKDVPREKEMHCGGLVKF